MRTDHPFMSITGGLEGGVLEVLAGASGALSLADIHGLMRVASKSGVRKTLLRLSAGGVVDVVPGGYALNREHLAYGAIVELAGLRRSLYGHIAAEVASWTSDIAVAGVFGSAARGEGDENSDIDVLVVGDNLPDDAAGRLSGRVRRWTGNECHVVALTRKELEVAKLAGEAILDSWRDDLVVLNGDRQALGKVDAS